MSDGKKFLESMSQIDGIIDHTDNCGQCYHQQIMSETARDMLKNENFDDAIAKWAEETKRRWEESKYFKLYNEEINAGRDPHAAFEAKGWEM